METKGTREFLAIYMNDHLAGAAGGVGRARALARAHRGSADGGRLQRLADDIATDRGALLAMTGALGLPVRHYKIMALAAMERAGRLKLNGRLRGRSPLTDLVEFEAMRVAIEGKAAGWRTLLVLADREPALDTGDLLMLLARAQAQATLLEELRAASVDRLFRGSVPLGVPARTGR
ncbi:hypothetical protein [Actinomadura roseirufa]|uniref:hypothetical protein n=1 Tax=Actinomadura roseirufa TaxID=2094049 RepID=UPI001040FFBF|nr:hypothetical protein [Actinomadura roseirufa]